VIDEEAIRCRFFLVCDHLDERGRRMFAAAESRAAGYGGIAAVYRATGIAPSTIGRGLRELDAPPSPTIVFVRRKGSGRRPLTETSPELLEDLRKLVEPATMGDPMRPLVWVSKSLAKLTAALQAMGYRVSGNTVGKLLRDLGFHRQGNRKTKEGTSHPDRDAQFNYINKMASSLMGSGQPVTSVDTKKKELVGDFKNAGTDYRPAGQPDKVQTHDFMDKNLRKVVPHGVYDVAANAGWVTVGIDNDTSEFAVNSLRFWWQHMGKDRYPDAKCLLITADCGGSNGARVRLWKHELQAFANETRLAIIVCHYPPGTSKWNKIEHRLFCHITQNWRGTPLISRQAVVELIGATTSKAGLVVRCELDPRTYAKGRAVSEEEMDSLSITRHAFHPEWNYTIRPQNDNQRSVR
jgi:hypothetical protein